MSDDRELDPSASASASTSSSTGESSILDEQLVKGLTFQTARRHMREAYGEDAWDLMMAALPRRTRALFETAETTEWYPESELRRFFHVVHEQLAAGDDARFREIAIDLAIAGVNRFFRMIIGLTSARFVLQKVPTIWKRLRTGPARLSTEIADDGRVLVHYQDYRYCRDPIYRQLSIANCQALVVAATGKVPEAEVLVHDHYSMTLAFDVR